jgi:hypothetical protein
MADQFTLVDENTCSVCPVLREAMDIIEELVEAVETGSWTMATIAKARRYMRAHPELRGPMLH